MEDKIYFQSWKSSPNPSEYWIYADIYDAMFPTP